MKLTKNELKLRRIFRFFDSSNDRLNVICELRFSQSNNGKIGQSIDQSKNRKSKISLTRWDVTAKENVVIEE